MGACRCGRQPYGSRLRLKLRLRSSDGGVEAGVRQRVAAVAIAILFLAGSAFGQERPKRNWHKRWIVSAVGLLASFRFDLPTAAHVLDAFSSRGAPELNPLMRNAQGRFSVGRAFAWKSAAAGSMLGVEALLIRRNPETAKSAAIVNFVAAGAVAGVAFRNTRVE